jgi:hypothetical protein
VNPPASRAWSIGPTSGAIFTATGTTAGIFSDEERAALRERGREVKATARRGSRAAVGDEEGELLAPAAETRISELVKRAVS